MANIISVSLPREKELEYKTFARKRGYSKFSSFVNEGLDFYIKFLNEDSSKQMEVKSDE